MDEVQLKLNKAGKGFFEIKENKERMAVMSISISGGELTALHTEVLPKAEGKGLAKKLLESMVAYARGQGLKVIALCSYVHALFERSPEEYADIWKKEAGKEA